MQTADENTQYLLDDREADHISRVEELSYELTVADVMTSNVIQLNPDEIMGDVIEKFRQNRISGAPVVIDGKLAGIISIEDIIRCLRENDLKAKVERYMTKDVITVRPQDPVVEALKLFVNYRYGRLVVTDDENHLTAIITKGDVTRGLLKSLQTDFDREEIRRYRASHLFEDINSDRSSLILRYNIQPRDFIHGGEASSNIKRALHRLGANPQIARKVGIAVYEAEMNLVIHTLHGGYLRVEIEPNRITIETKDDGPGIEDINQVMQPGFSTASDEIRALGFGAGMGLINISRCVDTMILESEKGKGTHLKLHLALSEDESVGEGWFKEKEDTV